MKNQRSFFSPSADIVHFDKINLLAARILRRMRRAIDPKSLLVQWWGSGHFISFVPGDEAEITAAIKLLIDQRRVAAVPHLGLIALPRACITKSKQGDAGA